MEFSCVGVVVVLCSAVYCNVVKCSGSSVVQCNVV